MSNPSERRINETLSQDLRSNTRGVYFYWSETSWFLTQCFNWCISLTSQSRDRNAGSISVKVSQLSFLKLVWGQVLSLSKVGKFPSWFVLFLVKEVRNILVIIIFLHCLLKCVRSLERTGRGPNKTPEVLRRFWRAQLGNLVSAGSCPCHFYGDTWKDSFDNSEAFLSLKALPIWHDWGRQMRGVGLTVMCIKRG